MFDFYLPEYEICLEFQGIQHFQPIERFGKKKHFNIRQKYDRIKYDFCNKNAIKLIHITDEKIKLKETKSKYCLTI
jgi:hypothetical protein